MRTLYELLICATHPRYELEDARNVMRLAGWHGIQGSVAENCLWCKGFHIHWQKPLEEKRLFWFCTSIVIAIFATVGAMVFKDMFWFIAYLVAGYLVALIGTFWQFGRLR